MDPPFFCRPASHNNECSSLSAGDVHTPCNSKPLKLFEIDCLFSWFISTSFLPASFETDVFSVPFCSWTFAGFGLF